MIPLFAETVAIDPTTQWVAVITAFLLAVTAIANIILQLLAKLDAIHAATAAADVKATLAHTTVAQAIQAERQNDKLDTVAGKVEEVHRATNSMKDELVKKTEAEALARGGVEERARADERGKPQ